MTTYRRVSSYKIMTDYKKTAKNLKILSAMADRKDRRFFRINKSKIEVNIIQSKMNNTEKNILLAYINSKDFHEVYCYTISLYDKYYKIYRQYESRMDDLFMSIEEKTIFYA